MNEPASKQPDDDGELSSILERAVWSLHEAGLTAQDIIDELPAAREELMHEWYAEEFLAQLDRRLAEHQRTGA